MIQRKFSLTDDTNYIVPLDYVFSAMPIDEKSFIDTNTRTREDEEGLISLLLEDCCPNCEEEVKKVEIRYIPEKGLRIGCINCGDIYYLKVTEETKNLCNEIAKRIYNEIQEKKKKQEELQNKNNIEKKENDVMLNTNKIFRGFDFGAIKGNDTFKFSPFGIAIKNAEGVYVTYDKSKNEVIDVDLIDIDIEGMLYKMPVAIKDIKENDVLIHTGKAVIVSEVNEKTISVIDPVNSEMKTILPIKSMFGFNFYTKIISLIDFNGASASEENPFGNLMPLMLMSGNNGSMESLLPLMLMSGNGFGDMAKNPMMLMALMGNKDGGKMSELLPLMLMSGNSNFLNFGSEKSKEEKKED